MARVVTQQPYSTHLIIEEDKPDGRALINAYDSPAPRDQPIVHGWGGPDAGSHCHVHLREQF